MCEAPKWRTGTIRGRRDIRRRVSEQGPPPRCGTSLPYDPGRLRRSLQIQQLGDKLSQVLIHRGTDESTAIFAAQGALACFQTAKALGNNPHTLVDDTQGAFVRVLTLGREPRTRRAKRSTPG